MQPYLEANFWKKAAACLIDAAVIYFHTGILTWFFHQAFRIPLPAAGGLAPIHFLIASSIMLTVSWLYFALTESSVKQASLGKLALGLMVTDLNGERLTFRRTSYRFLLNIGSLFLLLIPFRERALAYSRSRTALVIDRRDWQRRQ